MSYLIGRSGDQFRAVVCIIQPEIRPLRYLSVKAGRRE
ncbi:hypothetical protein thalar_02321 [Litoreibacter arenae DSM 19593]|uniref:Uncharacterized protein n=1 Tax=Litoreibacter arenae DSM 19593 TaxID=1123360 RepID=S9RX07_9RHOB|nr:hypothetical protein thalar_02321 [Litoreibacter arenae DSM 19593]